MRFYNVQQAISWIEAEHYGETVQCKGDLCTISSLARFNLNVQRAQRLFRINTGTPAIPCDDRNLPGERHLLARKQGVHRECACRKQTRPGFVPELDVDFVH